MDAEPPPTIWRVDDAVWSDVERVLAEFDPPARLGPGRMDQRMAPDGVTYRTRSGVQWNPLPREFGDDAGAHRTSQRWSRRGVTGRLGAWPVGACEERGGVGWQ